MKLEKFQLTTGLHPAGIPLTIQGYRLESGKDGKKMYIQGGIHGGEVTIWIVEKLLKYLQENIKSGSVTFIPVANPAAWLSRIYFNTPGKFDLYMGKDWNRNFPGSETGSLGQRIAHALFQEAIKHDFVLDLHTSRHSFPYSIFSWPNREYAKIIGCEYNNLDEDTNGRYTNAFTNQIDVKKIPNLTLECGSHDSYDVDLINHCMNGILRLCAHLGIINNRITPTTVKPKYYKSLITYRAPTGGFIKFHKHIGDIYDKIETLFETVQTDKLDSAPQIVRAQETGIIQKISPTHIYWPGDEVLQTIPLDTIQDIP